MMWLCWRDKDGQKYQRPWTGLFKGIFHAIPDLEYITQIVVSIDVLVAMLILSYIISTVNECYL